MACHVDCALEDANVPDLCGLLLLFMERSMFEFSFLSLQDNNITSVGYARLLDAVNTCIRNGIHVDLSMVGNPLSEAGASLYMHKFYATHVELCSTIDLTGCLLRDESMSIIANAMTEVIERGESNGVKVLCLNGGRFVGVSWVENFFTDGCVHDLLDVFSCCPRLYNISLEDMELSSSGIYAILNYFIKNKPTHPISFFMGREA